MYDSNQPTVQLQCPIEQFSDNFVPSKTFDGAMYGNNSRALYFFSNKPNIIKHLAFLASARIVRDFLFCAQCGSSAQMLLVPYEGCLRSSAQPFW